MSEAKSKAIEHKKHEHVKPVTNADKKLAKKHLKATIKFEKKKADEHYELAKKGGDKEYNHSHAKHHMESVLERKKMLTNGEYLK